MAPAPELKKFAPLIGAWSGSGTATLNPAAGPVTWTSGSTYKWCLGNHFVQEDTYVQFQGMPMPMVIRNYYGWDRSNKRFISLLIGNAGIVTLEEVHFLDDGTLVRYTKQNQAGQRFVERVRLKPNGDKIDFNLHFMATSGDLIEAVIGTMTKVDKVETKPIKTTAAMGVLTKQMQQIARMSGAYATKGQITMAPGMDAMHIIGTDTVTPIFSGMILHFKTIGGTEGMPGVYEAHSYICWDAPRSRFYNAFVSNMGELGGMDSWITEDGKAMISTGSMLAMGQPTSQRYITSFDDKGLMTGCVGHSMSGTHEPFVSFKTECVKK